MGRIYSNRDRLRDIPSENGKQFLKPNNKNLKPS